jgi:hypothetical protein
MRYLAVAAFTFALLCLSAHAQTLPRDWEQYVSCNNLKRNPDGSWFLKGPVSLHDTKLRTVILKNQTYQKSETWDEQCGTK